MGRAPCGPGPPVQRAATAAADADGSMIGRIRSSVMFGAVATPNTGHAVRPIDFSPI